MCSSEYLQSIHINFLEWCKVESNMFSTECSHPQLSLRPFFSLFKSSCSALNLAFLSASSFKTQAPNILQSLLNKNMNKNQSLDKRNKTRKNSPVPKMSMPPAPCPDTSRILSNYAIGVSFLAILTGVLSGDWEATRSSLPSLHFPISRC